MTTRGSIFGFFGDDTIRVIVADFPSFVRETRSVTNDASGNFALSTCSPCSGTESPFVPLPVSRPIWPVKANSIASITPLLPVPFGPEIANFSLPKLRSSFLILLSLQYGRIPVLSLEVSARRSGEYFDEVLRVQLLTAVEQCTKLIDFLGIQTFRFLELGQKFVGYLFGSVDEMPCLALLTTSTRIMRIHAHPGRSPDRLQGLHTLSNGRPLQIVVHCRQCLRFAHRYFQVGRIVCRQAMLAAK